MESKRKFCFYKYGILPDTEYTNNELMKVAGVLLGIGIFLLALFGVLSKKMKNRLQPTIMCQKKII